MKTVFVFALTITALASCRHREQEGAIDPAIVETGKVALTMGRIPDNVQCVQVSVASVSGDARTQTRDVLPGDAETTMVIDQNRVGAAIVSVMAFDAACNNLVGASETWMSDEVEVEIAPGQTTPVAIALYQVGAVEVGIFWEDTSGHFIDDMEHLNPGHIYEVAGRSGEWSTVNDGTCVQHPSPGAEIPFTTDSYNGEHAIATRGGPCFNWGANIGFSVNAPDGIAMAYDASGYAGIRFAANVTTDSGVFRLLCNDGLSHPGGNVCDETAGTCWDTPNVTLLATGAWEIYEVQWAELKPDGWSGNTLTMDARTLFDCQINFAPGDSFELLIDDVQFLNEAPPVSFAQLPAVMPGFLRGFNFGNRLDAPSEGEWGPVIKAANFRDVAARGFDHVRLPVRFNAHAEETAPYTLDDTFMNRVDFAIAQALWNDLSIVVDFHHYEALMADPQGHAQRFLAIWEQLATRYRDLPDAVAFELLNEPQDNLDAAAWNALFPQALSLVRQTNPTRLIIVDGPEWANTYALNTLNLPPGDPNLLASVHTYEPRLFTSQGQGFDWGDPACQTTGVIYPGPPATPIKPLPVPLSIPWAAQWFEDYNTLPTATNPAGPTTISDMFSKVASFIGINGYGVYNGEFGASNAADDLSRANWFGAIRTASENLGMGWAIWDNGNDGDGDMSYLDIDTGEWNDAVLNALFN